MSKKSEKAVGAVRHNTYTGKELAGFLVGLAGQNIIYNIISGGLQYFWQSIIFMPAMAISAIFFIARVWDAVNDPMMGSIVDKTRTKWGKCKPYLMFIPVPVGIITILTFCNGVYTDYSSTLAHVLIIGWAAVAYILWGMSYTIGDIPLWGVTSLMTDSEKDRSKALSLARIVANVGAIGMLITFAGKALSPAFQSQGMDIIHADKRSYVIVAVVLTVFATILFQFAGLSVKERVKQSEKNYTLKENFQTMYRNVPFRKILISGVLRSPIQLLSIVGLTLVMYYFLDNNVANIIVDGQLQFGKIIKLLLMGIGILGGLIIGTAVTPSLVPKFGKKTLYNFYSLGGALPYALIFVVYKISGGNLEKSWIYVILMAVMMFASSWAMG
ncbi:MAG: MFS transporter, partial [Ruminococcus sp.]|nr:MFS transporter [Ruminococcus sp.]